MDQVQISYWFDRVFNNARNSMTPNVLKYGAKNNFQILYELSSGEGFNREKIYGVTVLVKKDKEYIHNHELSAGGFSQEEAYHHISTLKGL